MHVGMIFLKKASECPIIPPYETSTMDCAGARDCTAIGSAGHKGDDGR